MGQADRRQRTGSLYARGKAEIQLGLALISTWMYMTLSTPGATSRKLGLEQGGRHKEMPIPRAEVERDTFYGSTYART